MFLASIDQDLGFTNFLDLGRQQRHQLFTGFGGNAAGAAVGDDALGIQRGEIGAGANIARLQFQPQAKRFNYPAAHLEFQRVITKQAQMPGTTARRDARGNGNHAALGRIFGKFVKIGGMGGFQWGEIPLLLGGQVTQAIQHHQRQLCTTL